jgi:hypothetical protein
LFGFVTFYHNIHDFVTDLTRKWGKMGKNGKK